MTEEAIHNIVWHPTFVYKTKVTDTNSGMRMDLFVYVCVSILQGSGKVVCALREKLNCSFQNKRASLCTNTTGGGFPFKRALLKSLKQPPNKRRPSHALPLSHTQIVCLSLCLSPAHSHTQINREPSSQGTASRNSTLRKQTLWTPTVKWGRNWAEKKGSLSLRGVKLFPLLWTWLTLQGHWQSTQIVETTLLAHITLTPTTPGAESQIHGPSTSWYLHWRSSRKQGKHTKPCRQLNIPHVVYRMPCT